MKAISKVALRSLIPKVFPFGYIYLSGALTLYGASSVYDLLGETTSLHLSHSVAVIVIMS